MFLSTLVTSPLYWETEEDFSQLLGGTTIIVPTAFRTSAIYSIFYTGFLNLGILGIFPLISLSYFNFHIIKELRTNRERLARLHIHILINGKARDAEQKMLSQSLIFTIFIFIFLHAILHIFNVMAELMIITIQNKEEMETHIIQHSMQHFSQAQGKTPTQSYKKISLEMEQIKHVTKY